eukprot:1898134-Lingulodinium_polyedra.AAC.1
MRPDTSDEYVCVYRPTHPHSSHHAHSHSLTTLSYLTRHIPSPHPQMYERCRGSRVLMFAHMHAWNQVTYTPLTTPTRYTTHTPVMETHHWCVRNGIVWVCGMRCGERDVSSHLRDC